MLTLRFTALCLVLLLWQTGKAADAPADSALQASIRFEQQLALFNQHIAELESANGPFDYALLEPLQGLTDLLVEAGNFEEAGRQLDRRLQLLRRTEGPSTLNQIPLITEQIGNDSRLQRWPSVTAHFERLQQLQNQHEAVNITSRLAAWNDLRNWHLTAIYMDAPRERIDHFLLARDMLRDIVSLAEEEYGEESVQLVPLLYSQAVEQYRVVAFISSADELGYDAREAIVARERRSWDSYLREGSAKVERVQEIVQTLDNPEAEAMAMFYVGDFQMLRRELTMAAQGGRGLNRGRGIAGRTYNRAIRMLRDTGIEEAKIQQFLSRPMILPVPRFHLSLEDALAQQATDGYTLVTADTDGVESTLYLGNFVAWNESLPFARRPAMPRQVTMSNDELYAVQARFSVNSVGKSRSPEVLAARPDAVWVRRQVLDAIRDMQFRPAYRNGRWREIRDVTMTYLFPPPR